MYKLGKITLSEYQKNYDRKLVLNEGKEKLIKSNSSVPDHHVAEMVDKSCFQNLKRKLMN